MTIHLLETMRRIFSKNNVFEKYSYTWRKFIVNCKASAFRHFKHQEGEFIHPDPDESLHQKYICHSE